MIAHRTMTKRAVPVPFPKPFGDLTIKQLELLKKKVKKKGFSAALGLYALIHILLEALERYKMYQDEWLVAKLQLDKELVSEIYGQIIILNTRWPVCFLGMKYVDTKVEVTFKCRFIL